MIVTRYVCNPNERDGLPRNVQATIGRIISGITTSENFPISRRQIYDQSLMRHSLLILPKNKLRCYNIRRRIISRLFVFRPSPLNFRSIIIHAWFRPGEDEGGSHGNPARGTRIPPAITADLSIRNENSRLHRYASTRFQPERALASHFARFQHFSTESRKGEFFATRATSLRLLTCLPPLSL